MKKKQIIIIVILSVIFIITFFPAASLSRALTLEDAQFDLALTLFRRGNYTAATTEFRRLLFDMKTVKYRDAGYYYVARCYLYMKNYIRAKKNLEIVVNTMENSRYHGASLYYLGRCQYLQKEYKVAITAFDTYVSLYPSQEYADNALYWKAESLLNLGSRSQARKTLVEILKRYPNGNKADAASFKLRLLDLEQLEKKETAQISPVSSDEGLKKELAQAQEELTRMKEKEAQCKDEITRLNNQIETLQSEITNLKEIGKGTNDEREKQIEEKIKALVSWENVLKVKEEALDDKEQMLDEEYERLQKITAELENND